MLQIQSSNETAISSDWYFKEMIFLYSQKFFQILEK